MSVSMHVFFASLTGKIKVSKKAKGVCVGVGGGGVGGGRGGLR